jgi:AcrR family transcriptional regulator
MTPRRYSMTRRAERSARTRTRIIKAALALYRRRGISATSIQEVGRRAEVSPATVLNHFRSADALAKAVIAEITRSLRLPDDREWTDARSQDARIRRLVSEIFAFYDRSTPWFELFRAEMGTVPALRAGERRFWAAIQEVYRRTLGSVLLEARLRGAVFGLTSPATLGALRQAGLSLEQASALVGDVLVGLIKRDGNERRPR